MLNKVVICGVDTTGLPKLTAQENDELMIKLKSGDKKARDKFIVGNMRLVLSLVKRFWAKNANADDVFQAGCVGLIKAIDNFDLKFGVKFSTYAVPTVFVLRNRRKELKMTRNQALLSVYAIFEGKNGHAEEIKRLKEVASVMPFTEWNDATVKDAVEYFMATHGRVPTVTDCKKENGLPSNSVIKQRYKTSLREWLTENFPTYYKPKPTRKQTLQFAFEALEKLPAAQEKIKDLLEEYPVCKWSLKNITDGVEEFFRVNKRLPHEKEFSKDNHLPDYGHMRYQYKCGLYEWYKTYCNALYEQNRRNKPIERNYLQEFIEEYERIKPCNSEDFNRRRDLNRCCSAQTVMKKCNIGAWRELLQVCKLCVYPKVRDVISEIEVVVVDENMKELYRYAVM